MQFYYYHPNHLGSSTYITNLDGEVSQHIEYVPFGEVFIDELELMRKSATAGKPTPITRGTRLIDSTIVPTRAEASLLVLCRVQPIVG
nr:hypothetical protein [Hoylesella timonensis]